MDSKKSLLRLDLLRGRYGRFMFSYLLFYTFQYIPLPLFPLAYVRVLKLTDGQISLGSALFYGVMILVSLRLGWITRRYGNHALLAFSTIAFAGYPLLIGLARDGTLYWTASFLGGVIWALLSAALVSRLMEVTPENERPACMSLHNLALNLGILVGSLSAPWLSAQFGLQEAILIGAGLRLAAGILIVFWG
jgi:MFS family permease